jgi:hypothetical protein
MGSPRQNQTVELGSRIRRKIGSNGDLGRVDSVIPNVAIYCAALMVNRPTVPAKSGHSDVERAYLVEFDTLERTGPGKQ